jgi:dTDP-L-rhamnose 4-epimerase
MRVLITGGAGFIGSGLALDLVEQGHEVTVLDCLSPQVHGALPDVESTLYASIRDKVRFVRGSVCDGAVMEQVLRDQEGVVHLAAETGTGQSMYEIRRYVDVNVGGTALLLDVLANQPNSVKRVVVASSRAIYGEGKYLSPDGEIVYPTARLVENMKAGRFEPVCAKTGADLMPLATDEESKIHPSSVYGITKQTQEQLVMTACPAMGIEPVALRYQNVYGPGQSLQNPYTGILSIFATRILNGNPVHIFEDGRESRDFVYIDDVVRATSSALLCREAAGHVIGFGSGVGTNVLTVAHSLVKHIGIDVPIEITGAFRVGDIRHNIADIGKAQSILGFSRYTSFEEGIRRFAAWVRQQKVSADTYDRSIIELARKGLLKQ